LGDRRLNNWVNQWLKSRERKSWNGLNFGRNKTMESAFFLKRTIGLLLLPQFGNLAEVIDVHHGVKRKVVSEV
jgi:hypothetical protein